MYMKMYQGKFAGIVEFPTSPNDLPIFDEDSSSIAQQEQKIIKRKNSIPIIHLFRVFGTYKQQFPDLPFDVFLKVTGFTVVDYEPNGMPRIAKQWKKTKYKTSIFLNINGTKVPAYKYQNHVYAFVNGKLHSMKVA